MKRRRKFAPTLRSLETKYADVTGHSTRNNDAAGLGRGRTAEYCVTRNLAKTVSHRSRAMPGTVKENTTPPLFRVATPRPRPRPLPASS